MKLKKIITSILSFSLIANTAMFVMPASAQDSTEVTHPYTEVAVGICDNHSTAIVTKGVEVDGKKVVKVVPTPDGAMAKTQHIIIDAYGIDKKGFDLDKYGYIKVEYKYDSANPSYKGKMGINLLKSKIGLKGGVAVESNSEMTAGVWNVAVFSIGAKVKPQLTEGSHILWQMHLYPFGQEKPANLTENDVLYIGDITFTSVNPDPDRKLKVSFSSGGATGGSPVKEILVEEGGTFKMPECTYEMEGYTFEGWRNVLADSMTSGYVTGADVNKTYKPGDEVTVGGANMEFFPKWVLPGKLENVKVLDYTAYYNGIIDINTRYKDISLGDEKVEIDGLSAIKALPNPNAETGSYFGYDGWSFNGANIDTIKYKYGAMLYKFDSLNEHEDFRSQIRILRGGFNVSKPLYIPTEEPLEYGKWDIVTFDFTKFADLVTPEDPIIKHVHVMPFQEGKISELDVGDTFYLAKLIFFEEKPESIAVHPAFINGYDDGTFRPSGNITRAEACTIIARLLTTESFIKDKYTSSFEDVKKGDWYYNNVAYLESLGLLKAYSGNFLPNQPITRAEFVELVFNIGLLNGGDNNGTFTDVASDHPRYNVITAAGKAGLVNGYDNGNGSYSFKPDSTITRAEVVKVINNAYGKRLYKHEFLDQFDVAPLYKDVSSDYWAYLDIMEASIPHGTYETTAKGEEWFYMSPPNTKIDHTAGIAKVAEIDELSAKRKAEILAAKDSVNVSGTKYYVSNDGNDSNDGKSPESAWATIAKVNASAAQLMSGDGVFFNRGDMFRGNLVTVSGVTYAAYGTGDKPKLSASEENGTGEANWTLVEGTTNIWKYAKQMTNLGGLAVVRDGEEYVLERTVAYYSAGDDKFYSKADKSQGFDYVSDLQNNCLFLTEKTTAVTSERSDIFLRCDDGNPGKIYSSIEFLDGKGHTISAKSNVTIDNLCVLHSSRHGIGAGTVSNLIITNCEVGWIGGSLHNYALNANGLNSPGRFGNGIEVYGGCDNFVIDNCYVYQCYDAGITNQYQKGGTNSVTEKNVRFTNNLIEKCCYSIEYFMGIGDTNVTRFLQNILYENNILREAGFGFGRGLYASNAAHIKGWDHYNMSENFVIRNNIFDRSTGDLVHIGVQQLMWMPKMEGNTYIQFENSMLGHIGANPTVAFRHTSETPATIANHLKEEPVNVYYLEPRK